MLIFDLETNGLLPTVTTVHCGVTYNTESKEYKSYRPDDIPLLIKDLRAADTIAAHNGINFDIPVIQKLYGINLHDDCKVVDTILWSKLAYYNLIDIDSRSARVPPRMKGSHALKAWGYRLAEQKGTYGEQEAAWDTFSEEMLEYCEQDVRVTVKLYEKLLSKQVPQGALDIEHDFARIINKQVQHGWFFNVKAAEKLHIQLLKDKEVIEKELEDTFKPLQEWVVMSKVKQFNKDGSESKVYQNQVARGALNKNGQWGRWDEIYFNPGSRHHIAKWLKHLYNWESPRQTEKGSPIIDESILKEVDYPEAQLLVKYFLIRKVLGMVAEGANGWLKLVRADSRIHGDLDTLGAVTGRCTHMRPNIAQVPSDRAFMGKECRQLFTVPEGKVIVGCDASGLELRMLAHYMAKYDNGAYGEQIVNGDIHTTNQEAAGLPTRANAKTFIYAFLYGAGNAKLGTVVGGGLKEGKKLKEDFFKKLPALKQLSDAVQKAAIKGFLVGLSKRKYYVRSPHSALNVLLQGAGAMIMKYYLVALDAKLQAAGFNDDYDFIGNIHDEVQLEVKKEKAEAIAKICEAAFDDVEKELDFRVKLEGEANIGATWNDTH
jgi:DNA polymerase-1